MPAYSDNTLTLEEMGAASLASLDAAAGKPHPDLEKMSGPDAWPLEKWHAAVYDTPFGQYDDENLARICRQAIALEYVVPLAIARLQVAPFAGEFRDGELLFAVGGISPDYWQQFPTQRIIFCQVISHALSLLQGPDESGNYDVTGYEEVYTTANDYRNIIDVQARLCREG